MLAQLCTATSTFLIVAAKAAVSELQTFFQTRRSIYQTACSALAELIFSLMALCRTCSTIPFLSLPPPPLPTGSTRIADKVNLPELWYDDSEVVTKDSPLGLQWHENLDALAVSAKICPLCDLAQKGAQTWLDLYEDASKNNKLFVEFHKSNSTIPTGQQLWLTKRFGGGPGFIVLVRGPKEVQRVILLTGVSFAVEAGKYSKGSPEQCSMH
jgi:hypothetical protein